MFLIVLVLTISSVCYAQQDRESGANFELMGGFGTGYPKHSSPKNSTLFGINIFDKAVL